ncbi:MAG: hypothetical protein A2014_02760 [Spirochaetes bacterium GWF1_49_6]|nr:MAG: hypothetical protein A2014_02760 [Spirochaetes bacterium GWF1_49_6]
MNAQQFTAKNRALWSRLTELLKKRRRTFDETREMGELYRIVTEHLSLAQTEFPEHPITAYLNQLVRDCHMLFYRPEKTRFQRLLQFLFRVFPETLARLGIPILIALGVFLAGTVISFVMVTHNVKLAEMFLDPATYQMARYDLENKQKFGNFDNIPEEYRVSVSFFIWYNNSRVSLYCFALGITLGLGTIYILASNGFMLGALGAFYYLNGNFDDFISLIMIHGSIELPAIIIAGGAGLYIGSAILLPGRQPRGVRLKNNARDAFRALAGVVFLLFISGLIEGLITPMKIAINLRLFVAMINTVFILSYFLMGFVWKRKNETGVPGFIKNPSVSS